MKYVGTRLREEIPVKELVSVHYFEFSKDYHFAGESHDFWELLYVDNGELGIKADDTEFKLKSGDIIIHRPNEWHAQLADGVTAPSVAIFSFKSSAQALESLGGKCFHMGSRQRTLISHILEESVKAFSNPLDELYTKKLVRRDNAPIGSEQLIKNYITELLISILRDEASPAESSLKRNIDSGLFADISAYMEERLGSKISLDDIARYAGISKTAVKQLFKQKAGFGACEFFTRMKIERAKEYIREGNYNFTEIAELLGYDSIHYFSRQFKNYVKMSPTEYSGSIRALAVDAILFGKEEENI